MCNCNHDCKCNHGAGIVPGPCVSPNCGKTNENLRIKTVVLPASVGTDAKGQPYAPSLGAFTNTIVQYAANQATYIYDSKGVFTKFASGSVVSSINGKGGDVELGTATFQVNGETTATYNGDGDITFNVAVPVAGAVEAGSTGYITGDEANTLQQTLNTAIETETTERTNAVNEISEQLQGLSSTYYTQEAADAKFATQEELATKQDTLVSGTSLKTVNGQDLLGEGNIVINAAPATELYTGTEATATITLADTATGFEKIVLLGYYNVAEGESVNVIGEWYSSSDSLTFSLDYNNLTTGETPAIDILQDQYTVSDTGAKLTLKVATKMNVSNTGALTAESSTTTPNFIITSVLGMNLKS